MVSLAKIGLTGPAFALLIGCMSLDNVDKDLRQSDLPTQAGVISPREQLVVREKIDLQIPFDRWELSFEHRAELREFLKNVRTKRKDIKFDAVIVTGHTDSLGPLSYNMTVSERLAEKAKDYLVAAEDIDPKLIFWAGKGPTEPIPVTKFCDPSLLGAKPLIDCLAPNRRVTVEVVGHAMPQQGNGEILPDQVAAGR